METQLPSFSEFTRLVHQLDSSLEDIIRQSVTHQRWLGYLAGKMRRNQNGPAALDLFRKHAPEMRLLTSREHLRFNKKLTPAETIDAQLDLIESGKLHHFDFFCLVQGHNARLLKHEWTRLQLVRLADAPGHVIPTCLYGEYLDRGLDLVLATAEPLNFSRLVWEVYGTQDASRVATLDLVPASSLPHVKMTFDPEGYCAVTYIPIAAWLIRHDLLSVDRTVAHARHEQIVDYLFTEGADIQRLKKSLALRLDKIERSVFDEDDRVFGYAFARRKFENFGQVLGWLEKHIQIRDFDERLKRIQERLAEIPERAPRRSVVRRLVFDDSE